MCGEIFAATSREPVVFLQTPLSRVLALGGGKNLYENQGEKKSQVEPLRNMPTSPSSSAKRWASTHRSSYFVCRDSLQIRLCSLHILWVSMVTGGCTTAPISVFFADAAERRTFRRNATLNGYRRMTVAYRR